MSVRYADKPIIRPILDSLPALAATHLTRLRDAKIAFKLAEDLGEQDSSYGANDAGFLILSEIAEPTKNTRRALRLNSYLFKPKVKGLTWTQAKIYNAALATIEIQLRRMVDFELLPHMMDLP